jgi:hypothetical protein
VSAEAVRTRLTDDAHVVRQHAYFRALGTIN